MATVGLIGTGAAYLNLRKAKQELAELEEQQAGLEAAIQTYNYNKFDEYYERTIDTAENVMPSGVLVTSLVRVGNLVGKIMRVRVSVVLSNASDERYFISSVGADAFVLDSQIVVYSTDGQGLKQEISVDKWLEPGETMEIQLPGGLSTIVNMETKQEDLGSLRDAICEACGKKLITSCPKISINGDLEKADILVRYTTETGHDLITGVTRGKRGTLRYCGEAVLSF